MPLKVKLEAKVADGIWIATGNFQNSEGKGGPAEVLFQESGKNKLKLMLNSQLKKSMLNGKEILSYANAQEVSVKKIVPGTEIEISTVWVTLKKEKSPI